MYESNIKEGKNYASKTSKNLEPVSKLTMGITTLLRKNVAAFRLKNLASQERFFSRFTRKVEPAEADQIPLLMTS
jgi:hypothetical protein